MDEEETQGERLRRTWPQRLMITAAVGLSVVCFAVAGVVWFTQQRLEERQFVVIQTANEAAELEALGDASGAPIGDPDDGIDGGSAEGQSVPVETFPQAEPSARNLLITGADNNACIDPDSRFAPAFGDRTSLGDRSDTIMVWRINPSGDNAAILSFPRDLWVDIAGRSSKNRINTAYEKDDPQRLIDTIWQNFQIPVDHFVQVDFCAFKVLVDAVDGVAVPFDTPVRDVKTGLFVPEPGCYTFEGEHALAYVRSRQMEYLDADGEWQRDGTSDLGRISRQQDFIERVVDELLANVLSPSVVRSLFETNREYLVTDDQLTLDRLLEFAGVVQRLDSSLITSYQIQARGGTVGSNAVLFPQVSGPNMQAVLAIFQGRATLASAVEQEDDDFGDEVVATTAPLPTTTTTTIPATTTTVVDPETGEPITPSSTEAPTTTELATTTTEAQAFEAIPEVEAEENTFGIVPDGNVRCP